MIFEHHAIAYRTGIVKEYVVTEVTVATEVRDAYYERLGIEEVRELVRTAYQHPADQPTQLLIVRTEFVTLEAQNALLKTLEEPPHTTHFVFVVPVDLHFIPTLLSRFGVVVTAEDELQRVPEFDDFVKQGYAERLVAIEKAIKAKDTAWQRAIKRGLLAYLRVQPAGATVAELEFIARWLLTRGASNKMLLEHLALLVSATK